MKGKWSLTNWFNLDNHDFPEIAHHCFSKAIVSAQIFSQVGGQGRLGSGQKFQSVIMWGKEFCSDPLALRWDW